MNPTAIEVVMKPELLDAEARRLEQDIADLDIGASVTVRIGRVYWLEGDLSDADVERVTARLLTDAISDTAVRDADAYADAHGWIATIRLKPGVTDAVGESVLKGARDLGVTAIRAAAAGRKIYLEGAIDRDAAESICRRLLVNDVIQAHTLRPIS